MNGPRGETVLLVMVSAVRVVPPAAIPIVLAVSVVPGFSQANRPASVVALERTSKAAVREYDPAARVPPTHALVPRNILVAGPFHPVVEGMLQRSGTFRRQVLRIAAEPVLTVRLELSNQRQPGTRARMRMTRQGSNRIATIEIPPLDDVVELIAHEMEHVIEQLDGIDLPSHAARKDGNVRVTGSDRPTFETIRARRVGLIVAREVRQ